MTHLVTPKLGELIGSGGTLLMETPLFLLQVTPLLHYSDFLFLLSFSMTFHFSTQLTDDQLAAFREKGTELAVGAGLQCPTTQNCGPCVETCVTFVKD